MNRAEIIRMAREAKGHAYTNKYALEEPAFAFSIDRLETFVSLVVAAERKRFAAECIDLIAGAADATGAWKRFNPNPPSELHGY
jgi:hypothetical protein